MKTTIAIKKIDLAIQAVILFAGLVDLLMNINLNFITTLMGWQLLSAIAHTVFPNGYYTSVHRNAFLFSIPVLVCVFGLIIFIWHFLFLYLALFCTLGLSLYYMFACLDELRILNRKAVVHLRK